MIDLGKLNIPRSLWDEVGKPLPETLQKNIVKVQDQLRSAQIIFVCGNESPLRDTVLAKLAVAYAKRGKIVRFYSPLDLEEFDVKLSAFINVLSNTDVLQKRATDVLKVLMMDKVIKGGVLIIGCRSVKTFSDKYGDEIVSYFSSNAVSIEVVSERKPIPVYKV